jgi:glyoxylase-like metal-dependent hydrolase (beta-lactamase superfamily II)
MILKKYMDPTWLSNSYLVADRDGGTGFIIDTGTDPAGLLAAIREHHLQVTHIFNTHFHMDHTAFNQDLARATGAEIWAHRDDAAHLPGVDRALEGGERLAIGDLAVEVVHIPGHTAGQVLLLVNGTEGFTGDTLFRRSIGGNRGPGGTTFQDLRRSILDVILQLPAATRLHPGHTDPTTVAEEIEENPFVRVMTGVDPEGDDRCTFDGKSARLIVWGTDYDGGHKAWIRFGDGTDAVVAGSRVGLVNSPAT